MRRRKVVSLMLLLLLAVSAAAEVGKETFTTKKGLKVTFLTDTSMDFIHAQLLIFYNNKYTNAAVPVVTRLNLFDKNVNKDGSGLLAILKRLGNDYEVTQTGDYLVLKINFLPGKLQTFARFLKELYTFHPFQNIKLNPDSFFSQKRERNTLRKFEDSIKNYWRYFYKKDDWKRDMAYQIGYRKLFPEHPMGNTLVTAEAINQLTLAGIRAFYQRTFRLPNSLVIIKGNFSPQLVKAYINSEFASFKQQVPEVPVVKKLKLNKDRRVIVYHTAGAGLPMLFWFNAVVPLDDERHFPHLALNNILFGFPGGRIHEGAHNARISSMDIQSEVTNQKEISVICNTVTLRARDIEKFIRLADGERQRLARERVQRKEYMDTLSYFYGKTKVDTQNIDSDVNHEILTAFYSFDRGALGRSPSQSPRRALLVLNQHLERSKDAAPEGGVIVIIGSYNSLRRHLKATKHIVYNYRR